ncbi:helix-turn-helix domain-containing protein [Amycolatopsis sp. NPDC004368]
MDLKALGDRIRRARKDRGFTQQKLATAVGASQVAVSEWERGVTFPSKFKELGHVLGLDVDEIYAVARSEDPVVQAITRQSKLPKEQREALITIYAAMLPE